MNILNKTKIYEIGHMQYGNGRGWGESQKVSDIMFFEAGVSFCMLEQELGLGTLIRGGLCNV